MSKTIDKFIDVSDPTSIDDIFIYKHKYEDEQRCVRHEQIEHYPLQDFINDIVRIDANVYYCAKTASSVPFNVMTIGEQKVCFYVKTDDKTDESWKDVMESIGWDTSVLKKAGLREMYDNVNNDFFIIDRETFLLDKS